MDKDNTSTTGVAERRSLEGLQGAEKVLELNECVDEDGLDNYNERWEYGNDRNAGDQSNFKSKSRQRNDDFSCPPPPPLPLQQPPRKRSNSNERSSPVDVDCEWSQNHANAPPFYYEISDGDSCIQHPSVIKCDPLYTSVITINSHPASEEDSSPVLKKPSIPAILLPTPKPKKIPSILKKKEVHSGATVSFDLEEPTNTTSLLRTKSIESNLSVDSETGYWSSESCGSGGILKKSKNKKRESEKSILKPRRSSLGSHISNTDNELQGILKRKLSYDSSVHRRSNNSISSSCGSISPEMNSILKKKSSVEDLEDLKPILKTHSNDDFEIKPILKKSSSNTSNSDCSVSGILKSSEDFEEYKFHSSLPALGHGSRLDWEIGGNDVRSEEFPYNRRSSEPNYFLRPSDSVHHQEEYFDNQSNQIDRSESEENLSGLSFSEKRSIFIKLGEDSQVSMQSRPCTEIVKKMNNLDISENNPKIDIADYLEALSAESIRSCESIENNGAQTNRLTEKPIPKPRKTKPDNSKSVPPSRTTRKLTNQPVSFCSVPSTCDCDPSELPLHERIKLFNKLSKEDSRENSPN